QTWPPDELSSALGIQQRGGSGSGWGSAGWAGLVWAGSLTKPWKPPFFTQVNREEGIQFPSLSLQTISSFGPIAIPFVARKPVAIGSIVDPSFETLRRQLWSRTSGSTWFPPTM